MSVAVAVRASEAGQIEITGGDQDLSFDLQSLPLFSRKDFASDIRPDPIDDENPVLMLPLAKYLSVVFNPGRVQSQMVVRLARFIRDELEINSPCGSDHSQLMYVASAIVDSLNGVRRTPGIPSLKIEELDAALSSLRGQAIGDPFVVLERLFNIQIARESSPVAPSSVEQAPQIEELFPDMGTFGETRDLVYA